jgi:hypothetical protein
MVKKLVTVVFVLMCANFLAQNDSTDVKEETDSLSTKFNIPLFSTSGGDVDGDLEQQDVSSLLSSSRDVFAQFASFQFGVGRYRLRGYMAENQMIMVNGVNVNNLETGFSSWSSWGGLNDVTRFVEQRIGVTPNRLGFSGVGGYSNIDSKASSFRKGTRISYGYGNRIFAQRLMVTHSTGMMQNGWAITLSASTRYGNEVYVPGTYFLGSAFYASVDKRINDKHSLSFTGFGAPIQQGRAAATTLEAYELGGSNYYNSLWGYQDGKKRNSQVSTSRRPMLMLSHLFKINTGEQLNTTLFYNFGKTGFTSLNWNDAPNPRPDYYRYLPSYYYDMGDTVNGKLWENKWANEPNTTAQLDWDRMINMNRANLTANGTRARYILENRIENLSNVGINSVYSKRAGELFISVGLNANMQKTRKYKELEDLLGASYWLDVDQFAENLGVEESFAQNNIETPNKLIEQGEKFGYDFSTNINRAEFWGQAEYTFSKMDVYGSLSISNTQIWREGFVANGKFPTTSKGESEKSNFLNYGIKGGAVFKIDGRNFVTVNGLFLTRAPEANNIFISPRVRNDQVNNVTDEKVMSGDITYMAKYPTFKFRATYYNTTISDQTWLRTFWSDEFNNNVNYIMTNVDQNHQGIEIGIEKNLFVAHTIQAAFGLGQFVYKGQPTAQAWQDNNNKSLFTERTVYLNNYRIGVSPQLVTGIGYRYNAKKFWFAGITLNYLDQIFIDPNPDRRTSESISKFVSTDPQVDLITDQEELPSYFTLNFNAGKSFRIMKKYFLNFNLSANNLLNNKNIITGGFESLRWDYSNINKFDNRYFYMTGTTFMATVNFNF